MTTILIAGATGLVGGLTLANALADDRIAQVVAPTRRPLPPHPRLNNPVVDFDNLPLDAGWWAVDGAVSALGTTRAVAGSAAAFRTIEGYIVSVAKALHTHNVRRFALTSSKGANPRSPFLYMKTKGEIEQEIVRIGFPSLTIARPGLIGGQRGGAPRLAERATEVLLTVMQPVIPRSLRISPAAEISRVLLEAAIAGGDGVRFVEAAEFATAGDGR